MNDKRNKSLLIFAFVVSGLLGCGPYTGDYLDIDHAHGFNACPSKDIEDVQAQAFEAMISTLADNNWVIEESSKQELMLKARACKTTYNTYVNSGDYLKDAYKKLFGT